MYYITEKSIDEIGSGVRKKIKSQINSMKYAGLECNYFVLPLMDRQNYFYKILRRLPFVNTHKQWNVYDFVNESHIYVRRLGTWDSYAIKFFQNLKKINPNCKIIFELPTYPYDNEIAIKWYNFTLLLKDRYYRRYLHKFIDRIATLTDDKEIFGIPTLKIGNGIDVEQIRPRQVRDTKDIHVIAVAMFQWWHGYDRFLEGLKVYYAANPSRKFFFHMVGRGSEFARYQKMVADYGLEEYVTLYGEQTGAALDDIYDKCNLGIASLGCYRKGMHETQELKSREYLAKGLPFIASVRISDIPMEYHESTYLQVPNNDSPVDIEAVIAFYDRIYAEGAENVNQRLRKFAQDHFSMEVAMKEVIDFFKDGK